MGFVTTQILHSLFPKITSKHLCMLSHSCGRNDLPWDVFQLKMTDVFYVVLDELMSGWRPKTTPTGGLPNITFESCKPVNLGNMIKNGCECITGMMVYHSMVTGAQQQGQKKYCDMPSQLPRREMIQKHVAEVLCQAEGTNIKEGGWIGGDAWFGSINAAVELKCRELIPLSS